MTAELEKLHELYVERQYLVMASMYPHDDGDALDGTWDWESADKRADDLNKAIGRAAKWVVVGEATREELAEQAQRAGINIDREPVRWPHYYRMAARPD
jgi:hypothetical protein